MSLSTFEMRELGLISGDRVVVRETDAQVALDIVHENVLGIPRIETHIPIIQNHLMKGTLNPTM